MRAFAPRLIAPALALLVVACASSATLARQSDEALAEGDLRKAYGRALSAVEKDPQNQAARGAYAAASQLVAADHRQRVVALAVADTTAAANIAKTTRAIVRGTINSGTTVGVFVGAGVTPTCAGIRRRARSMQQRARGSTRSCTWPAPTWGNDGRWRTGERFSRAEWMAPH